MLELNPDPVFLGRAGARTKRLLTMIKQSFKGRSRRRPQVLPRSRRLHWLIDFSEAGAKPQAFLSSLALGLTLTPKMHDPDFEQSP